MIYLNENKIFPFGFDYQIENGILTITKTFYTRSEAVFYARQVFQHLLNIGSDCVVFYYFFAPKKGVYELSKTVGVMNIKTLAENDTPIESTGNQRQ